MWRISVTALFVLTLVVSMQAPARARQARKEGRFRVYVFTAVDPARPDDPKQKARQDSVRDLDEILRQRGGLLMSVATAADADFTIEVISRGVDAIGPSVMGDQVDARGEHRVRSTRSLGSHKLVVQLAVPGADYRTRFSSGDLTWRSAARLAITQVQGWVKANGASFRR